LPALDRLTDASLPVESGFSFFLKFFNLFLFFWR